MLLLLLKLCWSSDKPTSRTTAQTADELSEFSVRLVYGEIALDFPFSASLASVNLAQLHKPFFSIRF
jgi:hypothetical protein